MPRQICVISCCVTAPIFRSLRRNGGIRKARRSGEPEYEPLYTVADADAAIKACWHRVDYGSEELRCVMELIVSFTDVGHLLGSASIEDVDHRRRHVSKKVVFSGDVGNVDQPIIKDPQLVTEADYLVIESTYGDRTHGEDMSRLCGRVYKDFERRHSNKGGNVVDSFLCGWTYAGDFVLYP